MTSRNQNIPPRSPSAKKEGIPLDKRRKIGVAIGRSGFGPDRKPLSSLSARKQDDPTSSDMGSTEGANTIDFTKESIDALLSEKLKMKKFDHKGNLELVSDLNSRLKLCIKWFQKRDAEHWDEEAKLRSTLENSQKALADTDDNNFISEI